MKKHNLLKVLLIVLLLVVIGSWFLPIVSIQDGKFVSSSNDFKIGLFSLLAFIEPILSNFGAEIVFILSIGALYGVLYKVPQYRLLLDKIAKGFEGKEWLFMVIVGVLFGLLTSMAGLSVVLLLFVPFVISIVLLMGYSKLTAVMLTVGSIMAGLIGTVFSASEVETLSYALQLDGQAAPLTIASMDVGWKIVLLVLSLAIVLVNTILYANKHKTKKSEVEESALIPKKVKSDNKKVYPLVIILDLLLVILTLAFISWDFLGVNLFRDMTKAFVSPTGSPFVKGLYGGINTVLGLTENNAFGNWTFKEAALLIFLASGLIAFIYRIKFNEFINAVGEGVKKALRPALLVSLVYLIVLCIANVPLILTVLRNIISLDAGFNLITMVVVALVFSFFAIRLNYGVGFAADYLRVPAVLTGNIGIIALLWQSISGVSLLISPTNIILISALAYADISYTKWMKAIWKVFFELLALVIIVLLIFNGLA